MDKSVGWARKSMMAVPLDEDEWNPMDSRATPFTNEEEVRT